MEIYENIPIRDSPQPTSPHATAAADVAEGGEGLEGAWGEWGEGHSLMGIFPYWI